MDSSFFGADNRNRTCMNLRSLEPESNASASSAISAYLVFSLYILHGEGDRGGAYC